LLELNQVLKLPAKVNPKRPNTGMLNNLGPAPVYMKIEDASTIALIKTLKDSLLLALTHVPLLNHLDLYA